MLQILYTHCKNDNKLFEKLKEAAITASNAREIKHLVKDTFSLLAIRKICSDVEE